MNYPQTDKTHMEESQKYVVKKQPEGAWWGKDIPNTPINMQIVRLGKKQRFNYTLPIRNPLQI